MKRETASRCTTRLQLPDVQQSGEHPVAELLTGLCDLRSLWLPLADCESAASAPPLPRGCRLAS